MNGFGRNVLGMDDTEDPGDHRRRPLTFQGPGCCGPIMKRYFRAPYHGIALALVVVIAVALPFWVGYVTGVTRARGEYRQALEQIERQSEHWYTSRGLVRVGKQ